MMKKQVNSRDLELLSAYLDQQLSTRQRARLEARLQSAPELLQALDDLRRTRGLLRRMPRVKAPRNFILKPDMVSQPQAASTRIYHGFRLASAIASLLFLLIFAADLFLMPQFIRQAAPQILAVQEAEEADQMLPAELPPAEPVYEEMQEPEEFTESFTSKAAPESGAAVEEDLSAGVVEEEAPLMLQAPAPESAPDSLAKISETPECTPDQIESLVEETPLVTVYEHEDQIPVEEVDLEDAFTVDEEKAAGKYGSWVRTLEWMLGLIALGAGAAALYFWRKSTLVG